MNKRVVYTCITGGYEKIVDPSFVQPDFDYICFTDQKDVSSKVWFIYPIPDELRRFSSVKQQRLVKILTHLYLPQYEESIYIDGSIDILDNLNDFLFQYCSSNKSVFIRKHPMRDCIYDEAKACVKLKKDTSSNIDPQMNRYEAENFPPHFGLVENSIIYRRHNDPYCVRLMEKWAGEIIKGSHRDQLSFNYCLWKVGDVGFEYLDFNLFCNPYFKWYNLHDR